VTTFNKTSLKALFETGDVPTGQNYSDMIDSQVNLVETAEQAMAGPLSCTQVITPMVSAANGNFTGTVSAAAVNAGTLIARGATTIDGELTVTSAAAFAKDVAFQGVVTFASSVIVADSMIVTASATFSERVAFSSAVSLTSAAITLNSISSGQAAQTATMTNSPVSGNPSFWIAVRVNGTTRYIPAW
jgi:hypothetical protein